MADHHYDDLKNELRAQADLASVLALLEWDQETFLPAGAQASRTRQIGLLAAHLHERRTASPYLDLIDTLAARIDELGDDARVDVRETKWRVDRQRALPVDLVRERAMLHAEAKSAWIAARQENDFARLAPYLRRIVATERDVARAIDPTRPPYETLLEEYEPGASLAAIEPLFGQLRDGLLPLVNQLRALPPDRSDATPLFGDFPIEKQKELNRRVATRLGFDFALGRIDEAAHPFSTTIGEDVRITTRYSTTDLRYALYSTIHETGHALYEQGLDREAFGLPRGTSCSLGVHESQSRLWENNIGRSEAFWRFLQPLASDLFPELEGRPVASLVRAANEARPSYIRTESDEITYNLHIILRFELEKALIEGDLPIDDLPHAWREKMQKYLGIVPPTDREGVLQDVHWPSGAIGYFPTYSLGNVYAAHLMQAANVALGPVDELNARGEFAPLLGWLRTNIHRHGQSWRGAELIERASGTPATPNALLTHLQRKLEFIRG